MTAPLLRAHNLSRYYTTGEDDTLTILDAVNLTVHGGDFMALTGPSGSGKSTLLRCLSGLDQPDGGAVELSGTDLADLREPQLARLRRTEMGFVFQHTQFLNELSLLENIMLPALRKRGRSGRTVHAHAEALMADLGIDHLTQRDTQHLSGGERQRAGICRALINTPSVLFADEPTGALHSESVDQVLEIFTELNRQGTTILLVTHDRQVASRARHHVHLVDGHLEEPAPSEAFRER